MARRLRLLDYVKAAFYRKWNLALLALGLGAGLVTLEPGLFWLPTLALELLFLLTLSQNARFQRLCEAKAATRDATQEAERFSEILARLTPADRGRFEKLRVRCEELIRAGEDAGGAGSSDLLQEQRVSSTNQLLWMFVRALTYRSALQRFLAAGMQQELRARLRKLETEAKDEKHSAAARKTLEENLKVIADRLTNFERADANVQLVEAELSRIEDLASLVLERSLTSATLGDLDAQVEGVSTELSSMETALREVLGDAPAIAPSDKVLPAILPRRLAVES